MVQSFFHQEARELSMMKFEDEDDNLVHSFFHQEAREPQMMKKKRRAWESEDEEEETQVRDVSQKDLKHVMAAVTVSVMLKSWQRRGAFKNATMEELVSKQCCIQEFLL